MLLGVGKGMRKMAMYEGSSGQMYTTTKPSYGKGRVGEVYSLEGMPGNVAKIYDKPQRTEGRKQKLSYMTTIHPLPTRTAWPQEIINENMLFAGYVMPKVDNSKAINLVYASNNQIGNLQYRLAVAHYLCDAVHEVHQLGQVVGDFNPNNIRVSPNGSVTLVDTDSFHIQNPNTATRPFRCVEAHPEFVAPELLCRAQKGASYETLDLPTFTKATDRFAVAIHVFALLMNGYHPYVAGMKINPGQSIPAPPTKEGGIRSGVTPYFMNTSNFVTPDDAPAISTLPNYIQEMFRITFVDGHSDPSKRPTCEKMAITLRKWFDSINIAQLPIQSTVAIAPTTAVNPPSSSKPVNQVTVPTSPQTPPMPSIKHNVGFRLALLVAVLFSLFILILAFYIANPH